MLLSVTHYFEMKCEILISIVFKNKVHKYIKNNKYITDILKVEVLEPNACFFGYDI